MIENERFIGTRYAYNKGSVAMLIPFVFLIPAAALIFTVYLLRSRALLQEAVWVDLPMGTKAAAGLLGSFGLYVTWDLWKTFRRVMTEQIVVTPREIVWLGDDGKVLLRAPHEDILSVRVLGRAKERAWRYEIATRKGKIRFTKSLVNSAELISEVEKLTGAR